VIERERGRESYAYRQKSWQKRRAAEHDGHTQSEEYKQDTDRKWKRLKDGTHLQAESVTPEQEKGSNTEYRSKKSRTYTETGREREKYIFPRVKHQRDQNHTNKRERQTKKESVRVTSEIEAKQKKQDRNT